MHTVTETQPHTRRGRQVCQVADASQGYRHTIRHALMKDALHKYSLWSQHTMERGTERVGERERLLKSEGGNLNNSCCGSEWSSSHLSLSHSHTYHFIFLSSNADPPTQPSVHWASTRLSFFHRSLPLLMSSSLAYRSGPRGKRLIGWSPLFVILVHHWSMISSDYHCDINSLSIHVSGRTNTVSRNTTNSATILFRDRSAQKYTSMVQVG